MFVAIFIFVVSPKPKSSITTENREGKETVIVISQTTAQSPAKNLCRSICFEPQTTDFSVNMETNGLLLTILFKKEPQESILCVTVLDCPTQMRDENQYVAQTTHASFL